MKIAIPTDLEGGLSDTVFNHFGMAPYIYYRRDS